MEADTRPAHNASRKHVDDERDVDKAAPGCDVREIGDPELIRTGGHESAVNEVHRATALTCVTQARPRTAPARPIARIRRATVQRATRTPSRRSCFQTFRGP